MCHFSGGTMHICDETTKRSINRLAKYIRDNEIDFLDLTPAYVRQINRYLTKRPDFLQRESLVVVGSESWFVEDMLTLKDLCPQARVMSSYGLTEAVIDSGVYWADEVQNVLDTKELVPIGYPFGETEFIILDDKNKRVEADEEGELCIASKGLASGYIDSTSAKNFDWYDGKRIVRTGDLVVQNSEGLTKLIGRKDHLVKMHGRRIDLKHIEKSILDMKFGVEDIAFLPYGKDNLGNLTCFICLNKSISHVSSEEILNKIQEITSLPTIPVDFKYLEKIPRKEDGKTDYSALRGLLQDHSSLSLHTNDDSVSDANLRLYKNIFCEYLGNDFDENKDIFLQGADSLMVEEIIVNFERETGIVIPYESFYHERSFYKIISSLNVKLEQGCLSTRLTVDDLRGDYSIPSAICNHDFELTRQEEFQISEMNHTLLTGSTGFLGIHILHELLVNQEAEAHCLVRAQSVESALNRLKEKWTSYFNTSFPAKKCHIVLGDFTKPGLGMEQDKYNSLSSDISGVIHAGYWINFLLDYHSLKDENVGGLDNILLFASQGKPKPLIFVSSSSASLIKPQDFLSDYDGYELTKYVNERKLENYGQMGYPYAIVSPAIITPPVENPVFSRKDFFWSFIQSCVMAGSVPDIDWLADLVPVTGLSEILCSRNYVSGQKVIVTNEQPLVIGDIQNAISYIYSKSVKKLPFDQWLDAVRHESITQQLPLQQFISGLELKGSSFFDSGSKTYPSKITTVSSFSSSKELLLHYLQALKV